MRFVALTILFLGAFAPLCAQAATLYIDPASGSYGPGDTFIAAVRTDTAGECINAAHVEIAYPKGVLRVVDVGRGDSIFSLWVEEPKIDQDRGLITFSGGIPGGYCGKIEGDPQQTNVLGKVIFTVLQTDAKTAGVSLLPTSAMYLNDGLGTSANVTLQGATFTVLPKAALSNNEWVDQVGSDTTPPEPFTVQVESTRGVFSGAYYAVFSTVDKQSGMDHYEIFEDGFWKRITNPYRLSDQRLRAGVEIKAIDKAGNERIGEYNPSATPPPATEEHSTAFFIILGLVLLLIAARWYWRHTSGSTAGTLRS
jgi:hypothetical protein